MNPGRELPFGGGGTLAGETVTRGNTSLLFGPASLFDSWRFLAK